MPKGQLLNGRRKVWGVVSEATFVALEVFQRETGLPNLCQTIGVLLDQWSATRTRLRHQGTNRSQRPKDGAV